MRILAQIVMANLLLSCAGVPEPEVSKERWLECWNMCGKGDKLESVTPEYCYCKGGWRTEKKSVEKPVEESKPLQLFDWLSK